MKNKAKYFMKRKLYFLTLLMCILSGFNLSNLNAQTPVTIGSGTESGYSIADNYDGHGASQQIYTAAEVGSAGTITSLAFNKANGADYNRTWSVYLKNIDEESFTSTTNYAMTSADLVYEGAFPTSNGWNVLDIDDFHHDGRNLLVTVVDNSGFYGGDQNWYYTFVYNDSKCLTKYSYQHIDITSQTTFSAFAGRFNIQLTFEGGAAPSAPVNLQTTVNGTSVLLKWDAVDGATNYNVYQGESIVANVVDPTQTFTNLNPGTYCYTVTAINDGGESEKSEETCATIQDAGSGDNNGNNVVSIGYPTTNFGTTLPFDPFNGKWGYSQQIYTAAEIKTPNGGEITKIAFKQQNDVKVTRNIVVYMQNTTKTKYSGTDWENETDEHIVFSGEVTTPGKDGYLEIVLPTPFEYTGGNLMISVLDNTGAMVTADSRVYFYRYATDTDRSIRHTMPYGIANPYKPGNMSVLGEGTIDGVNNTIDITFGESEPEPEVAPSAPTNLSASAAISEASIVLTWDAADNATSYNIYNYSNDELVAEGVTETTYTHEGLELATEYCYYVKAVNAIGISDASNQDCATTFDGSANMVVGDEILPEDDNRWYLPINSDSKYSFSQQIYTSEALGIDVACEINKIAFFQTASRTITRNLEIYMQFTDKRFYEVENSGNSSYDGVNMNDSYKVFDGEYTFVEGECVINLDKSFLYIPGKSILISVLDKTGVESEQLNFNVYQTEDLSFSSLYYYGDDKYAASSLNGVWTKPVKRNNQIKLYYEISPASIVATPESLGFFFKSEGWSEKIEGSKNITIIKKNTDISSIAIEGADASFFTLPANYDLNDNPIELEIGHGNLTAGQKTANLVITYNEGVKYIPLTASIYDPETPDIWELAQEVDLSRGTYTHTPDFTKLHDDYILPKEEPEGNAPDAVYVFTLQNEESVEVTVTGTNNRYAIYSAADLAGSGPSSSNVYRKVTPSFFYDFNDGNLEDFRMVEYDNNYSQWRILEGAGQDDSNTLVSYSYDSNNGATKADNYIITKNKYVINENSKLSFDVLCGGEYGGKWDNVMVKVSTDGETFTLIETIDPQSSSWSSTTVTLGDKFADLGLEYGNYYIALHHKTESDIYDIKVDNLRLSDGSSGEQSGSSNSYPAGEYYLVAAAESEFTVNINVKSVPTPIFTGVGNWNDAERWDTGVVPSGNNIDVIIDGEATVSSDVIIRSVEVNSGRSLTIESGSITVIGRIVNDAASAFIIEDGAQVFQTNDGVIATFRMNVENPTDTAEYNPTGWQFISSPMKDAAIAGFETEDGYDLFKYVGDIDTEDDLEWVNYKGQGDFEAKFQQGRGYMASYHAENGVAEFVGELNNETTFSFDSELEYTVDDHFANFFLLGNPFTFNMKWNDNNIAASGLAEGYAVVTTEGGYTYATTGEIKVGDGFFVKAEGTPSLTYTANTRGRNKDNNYINLIASGKAGQDNVIINFADNGRDGFNKLENFNKNIAEIYVTENESRYGILNYSEDVEEINIYFNAKQMGYYTINALTNADFANVTLVDRLTGIETDILADSYTFQAMTDDAPDRFILRMNRQVESENFVYRSGEELIINAEGSVQIIDVMGRIVYSNEIVNDNHRVNIGSLNDAAYIVRVVNANEVKTQKVVIW